MTQTTREMHTRNGEYDDHRIKEHDGIIEKLLCGAEGNETPNSILLGGGSASGKSRSSRILLRLDSIDNDEQELTVVDCDSIKLMIPEYSYYEENFKDDWAFYLHDESSDIADKAIQRCIETRRDFIFDGTMKNIEKYETLIRQLHTERYKVNAMVFDVPIQTAIERNKKRQLLEGRLVPEDILIQTHVDVSKAFLRLKDLVDTYVLYDNSLEYPDIISIRIDGEEKILNKKRLEIFLEKSSVILKETGTFL
ncbi:zeta toxin family protein [Paenibacillus sp. F6_3S_P_1C]|uniref:UDP-N-acetylglucosamine kinase n=1 Tax=Paenibacillus vandeheii TaxID=3035917 RepID=A0ABT8J6P3_9BACL|nr:zeta toxin family protein [Paenibacillus vandeheii]MDN4600760.1 zeta toxin family protein [Paenibacillus vandeheii]